MRVLLYAKMLEETETEETKAKMLEETETEETKDFFVTFLSLVVFQFGGGGPTGSSLATPMAIDQECTAFSLLLAAKHPINAPMGATS